MCWTEFSHYGLGDLRESGLCHSRDIEEPRVLCEPGVQNLGESERERAGEGEVRDWEGLSERVGSAERMGT